MKFFKVIRAAEWWDYKLPPILAAAYLVLSASHASPESTAPLLIFVVLSLIAGAIYVSIINDMTDIREDMAAGKPNRMEGYGIFTRIVFLATVLSAAFVFCWYMRHHTLSLLLYGGAYVMFTLYSVPPFRLKERKGWGVLADAAGSQLLPTLYTAVISSAYLGYALSNDKFLALGLWSLAFGLRGILWHQFHDLHNDARSGVNTWARQASARTVRLTGYILIVTELCSLAWMLFSFGQYMCFAALGIYLLYVMYIRKNGTEIMLFRYTRPDYCIFMSEYYQLFLPLTVLVSLTIGNSTFVYLLMLHAAVFHMGIIRVLKRIAGSRIKSIITK